MNENTFSINSSKKFYTKLINANKVIVSLHASSIGIWGMLIVVLLGLAPSWDLRLAPPSFQE